MKKVELSERDRCKLLMELTMKLIKDNDINSLKLLSTFIENDTPSIKKGFELIMNGIPQEMISMFGNNNEPFQNYKTFKESNKNLYDE